MGFSLLGLTALFENLITALDLLSRKIHLSTCIYDHTHLQSWLLEPTEACPLAVLGKNSCPAPAFPAASSVVLWGQAVGERGLTSSFSLK